MDRKMLRPHYIPWPSFKEIKSSNQSKSEETQPFLASFVILLMISNETADNAKRMKKQLRRCNLTFFLVGHEFNTQSLLIAQNA